MVVATCALKLCNIMLVATKLHLISRGFVLLTLDHGGTRRISVACDIIE